MEVFWEYARAFLCGGALCLIGQLLIDKTKLTPARILVLYVVSGVVLGGLGLYKYVVEFGGAGATVPLTGFGYLLAKGAAKAVDEMGILGALTGGVTGPHNIPDIGFGLVPKNFNSYVVDNVAAVSSKDAQRAAQQVLRTDAIPASASAGAALHAAAKLVANGISRSALAVFSGRQNLL